MIDERLPNYKIKYKYTSGVGYSSFLKINSIDDIMNWVKEEIGYVNANKRNIRKLKTGSEQGIVKVREIVSKNNITFDVDLPEDLKNLIDKP